MTARRPTVTAYSMAMRELLRMVRPEDFDTDTVFSDYDIDRPFYQRYEILIHELAHHVTLRGSDKFLVPTEETVAQEIERTLPSAILSDANEIMTLAVEFVASEMLGIKLDELTLTRLAMDMIGSLELPAVTASIEVVRRADHTKDLARTLASHVKAAHSRRMEARRNARNGGAARPGDA